MSSIIFSWYLKVALVGVTTWGKIKGWYILSCLGDKYIMNYPNLYKIHSGNFDITQ